MKSLTLVLASAFMLGAVFTSCNTNKDDDDKLPDAVFNAVVTGAVSQNISFTLPENVAGTEAVNGSYSGATDMFSMLAMNLGGAWQLSLAYNSSAFQTGTYDISTNCGFTNPSLSQAGFLATGGTITISKADLFQGVGASLGAADDYFVDGSFTTTMASSETPPQQIQVSGTFTGINIKAN